MEVTLRSKNGVKEKLLIKSISIGLYFVYEIICVLFFGRITHKELIIIDYFSCEINH
jgi:hypothetical protein